MESILKHPVIRINTDPTILVVVALLLSGLLVPGIAGAQPALAGAELGDALRRGGFVIFFRHGAADTSDRSAALAELPPALRDCYGAQRPLTPRGVTEMRAVGEAFRALGLPVGRVLSSSACRSIETAWYAFGRVEGIEPELLETRGAPTTVRRLLADPPPPGTNTVIVGHVSNTLATLDIAPAEGEALVFAPGPGTGARLVARVPVDGWPALAPAAR